MHRRASWFAVLAATLAAACASSGGVPGAETAEVPPGEYLLEARIEVRADTEHEHLTERQVIRGELFVPSEGAVQLLSDTGPCRTDGARRLIPTRPQQLDFDCGETYFTIRFERGRIEAEATRYLLEQVRRVSGCRSYTRTDSGRQVCSEQAYMVVAERRRKTAKARVERVHE